MGDLLSSADMHNVLSQHVCSKLRPCDIQALGATCILLRQLVFEQLPASTWEAIAENSLPAAHPLLQKVHGSEVRSYLERIARAKRVLPQPECIGSTCPSADGVVRKLSY